MLTHKKKMDEGSRDDEKDLEENGVELEEMKEESLPTADPVSSAPVGQQVVAVAPTIPMGEEANLMAMERLSRIVIQLAVLNFMLGFCLELYVMVIALMSEKFISIVSFLFAVGFYSCVAWLGVRGVKTRNAPCCDCCQDCGYLQAFQFVYVIFAVLRAVRLLVAVVYLETRNIVYNFLLLLLTASTAEYTRQLLVVMHKLPPVIRATIPTTESTPVPLATAQPL